MIKIPSMYILAGLQPLKKVNGRALPFEITTLIPVLGSKSLILTPTDMPLATVDKEDEAIYHSISGPCQVSNVTRGPS
jgi:hypothetical protein